MKIIEKYILQRSAKMVLVALLPVLAIIWTTQVLGRVNLVTDNGQSIGSFMLLASCIVPMVLPLVLPFATVIGVSQTLTTMNTDSELTVIEASGAGRSVIFKPVLVLAAALSLLSFVVDNGVEPKVRVTFRELIASAYADLLSSVIEEKSFRQLDTDLYIQISRRLAGRTLEGLFISDTRNPAFQLIYYAREGAVDEAGTALIMRDGEVHRKTTTGDVSVVRFDSYTFDLSNFSQTRGQATLQSTDRDLPFLWNPDPNDEKFQKNPGEFRAELHRRLTEWSFPLVYALIALVIAGDARSQREARVHPMVTALGFAFLLRWASFYFSNQVETDAAYIPAMYAVPIVAVAVTSWLLFRGRRLQVADRLTASARDRLQPLVTRLTDGQKNGRT
ncbi:LptF/LptG family permease [Gellertiella hungarica]|uniref:Lipopolysaccharide export system permease protein n=1 Tax=Gellertiella hungarica TaxID=1572859 RepID=A0A7W6NLL3_9HYPH|nr:LptF/LptG family permease [Gellertiella hungarica]MBB4065545.1 lipopolysaccharide export system permease protein [Gellertiella hungarica]